MTGRPRRLAASTLFLLVITAHAHASDWYVNKVSGSDSNSGSQANDAWRTITHASAALASSLGPQTIHLAAGTYSSANGELFPIVLRDDQRIVGDAGARLTFIEAAGPTGTAFRLTAATSVNPNGLSSGTMLVGMTLRNWSIGVSIETGNQPCDPTLRGLAFLNCAQGVLVNVGSATGTGTASASPRIEHSYFEGNVRGVSVTSPLQVSGPAAGVIHLLDSTMYGNVVAVRMFVVGRESALEVDRTNIFDCTVGPAIEMYAGNYTAGTGPSDGHLTVRDSVLAENAEGAIFAQGGGSPLGISCVVRGCTITRNYGYGVRKVLGSLEVSNSIVWNNLGEIQSNDAQVIVRASDVGDGGYLGQLGTIQEDPLFANAPQRDFRLRFGSPCVDHGDPAFTSTVDSVGAERTIDGDLDRIGRPDMGAIELQTLRLGGPTQIGRELVLELSGSDGLTSRLFMARAGAVAAAATPFGDFRLPFDQAIQLADLPVAEYPPYTLRRAIPNNPVLIGKTFSFQALTHSFESPTGAAYTNPVSFVILP